MEKYEIKMHVFNSIQKQQKLAVAITTLQYLWFSQLSQHKSQQIFPQTWLLLALLEFFHGDGESEWCSERPIWLEHQPSFEWSRGSSVVCPTVKNKTFYHGRFIIYNWKKLRGRTPCWCLQGRLLQHQREDILLPHRPALYMRTCLVSADEHQNQSVSSFHANSSLVSRPYTGWYFSCAHLK